MLRSIFLMAIVVIVASLAATSLLQRVGQSGHGRAAPVLGSAPSQPFTPLAPARGSTGSDEIAIAPDRSGNYVTDVEIDGHFIHMIVDTGATYVSLTNEDASAIGLHPAPADFRYRTMTANGTGVAAKVWINRLRLGQLEVDGVDAFVMPPGTMGTSLLGMSALRRLGSVEISDGQLVLRQ